MHLKVYTWLYHLQAITQHFTPWSVLRHETILYKLKSIYNNSSIYGLCVFQDKFWLSGKIIMTFDAFHAGWLFISC